MSEFRQNPITKNWVLIAPARAKKPEDYRTYSVMSGLPELDHNCVFCPGNEEKNPDLCDEVCRIPNSPDWQIRVIPNKYQALESTKLYRHHEFYTSRAGYGDHEVIITRKHNEPVALQSAMLVELSLKTFIDRINDLKANENIAYVHIFHNHGRDAGASLVHPHYQIISTPFVPKNLHSELQGCAHYYDLNKSCIYCDIMKEERKLKDRIVYENEHFTVMSAYASRKPFETWVLPKRHGARFEDITPEELKHLAYVLKVTLGQLYTKLSDPPLNFYIHNMPFIREKRLKQDEKSYHWHLTIFPRLTIWAGFEYGTGIPVNPMPPEETARFLREQA
jgi:UDPglucose--hexose-1-phosphate uridylyltransferase